MGLGLYLLNFRRSTAILPLSSNSLKILHNIAQAPSVTQTGLVVSSVPAWLILTLNYNIIPLNSQ